MHEIDSISNLDKDCRFLLFDDNSEKNFQDLIYILDRISYLQKEASLANSKKMLLKWYKIAIYIRVKEDEYSALIDTALKRLGDYTVRVYIIDDNKWAAQYLLYQYPLFQPIQYITGRNLRNTAITLSFTVISNHNTELACWLVKEAFWLGCFHYKKITLSINIIGPNANEIEQQLRFQCPGIYGKIPDSDSISKVVINKPYEVDSINSSDTMNAIRDCKNPISAYAYLVNDSGEIISNQDKIASYIFSDDISTESDYCRYIDTSSKKIGYMNTHAEIKIPAQYEEAEEMKGGFAVVSEDLDKGYFYIDQNGNRLNSENYKFCDSFNDFLARVEKMDGSWSIITRDNRTVVENYDSINELPSCHSTLTGIKDQKAVILKLDMYDEIYETKILEDSDSISAPVFDCFAITRNNNGYGVVDIISGEQVIPNSYEKIEDRIIEDDGNWIRVKFICKNSKGEYEIIEKQF